MSAKASACASSARSSTYKTTSHRVLGWTLSKYRIDRTVRRPLKSIPSAWPDSTNHDNAPKHTPYVEGPPGRPPTLRHGQIASQLHPSKYEPATRQRVGAFDATTDVPPANHNLLLHATLRCCHLSDLGSSGEQAGQPASSASLNPGKVTPKQMRAIVDG